MAETRETPEALTSSGGEGHSVCPLDPTLRQVLMVPSDDEVASRELLFASLASSLLGEQAVQSRIGNGPDAFVSTTGEDTLALVQVGLHGMGLWTTRDTMECLCIGTVDDDEFVNRVKRNPGVVKLSPRIFRNAEESEDEVRLIISLQGVSINIQYCQTPAVEDWNTLHSIPAQRLRAPPGIVRALNGYRDAQYICSSVPDLEAFKIAYRFLVQWAHSNGLFSGSLGYLDHSQIVFMLNKVTKLDVLAQTHLWYDVVRAFFSYYSSFSWQSEIVVDSVVYDLNSGELPFKRGYLTPAVVLTINTPLTNLADLVSEYSLETLVAGFKRAEESTAGTEYGTSWLDLLTVPTNELPLAADGFINSFSDFVCFEAQYWGPSKESKATFYTRMGTEFKSLCESIKSRRRSLRMRPWPNPFTEKGKSDDEAHAFYLIGLEAQGLESNTPANRKKPLLEQICNDFLKEFTERGAADPTLSRVDVSIVGKDVLGDIVCDTRDWNMKRLLDTKSTASKTLSKATSGKGVPGKLRPASDVLNRLVWDPNIDRTSFIIGYEDRFLGSKELPLELWKTDLTEEEFIPLHRILYFKKKSDGEIVWDRNSRVDKIFGSGNR